MTISAVGVFSGCGGFDLGAARAGFNMVAAYDSDPVAVETYRHNVSENIKCMLIEEECPPCLPNQADLLIGGPPCQGFSSAGPKLASDPRNELWKSYVSILKKLKPKAFILENVWGFLRDYDAFLRSVSDATNDKYVVDFRKINSQFYGVPQHRLRLFIVGIRTDIAQTVDWPTPDIEEFWGYTRFEPGLISITDALEDLGPANPIESSADSTLGTPHAFLPLERSHIEPAWNIPNGGSLRSIPDEYLPANYKNRERTNRGWPWYYRKPNPTLPARTVTASIRPIYTQILAPDVEVVQKKGSWSWGPVDPQKHTNQDGLYTSPVPPRRLTIKECARLQTFPDNFEFFGRPLDKHRQIGNAVPVVLAERLCRQLSSLLA